MANLLNLKWVRFTTVRHASEHTGTAQINTKHIHTYVHAHTYAQKKADNFINDGIGITATALQLKALQLLCTNSANVTRGSYMQWLVTSFRRAITRK